MARYRIHRMRENERQRFRWAPHVGGCAAVKQRDFELAGAVEALHEYDAWRALRETGEPLGVGDLLENEAGQLRICKYVGFEPAEWVVAEPKGPVDAEPAGQAAAH